ncbi:hypothetical protein MYO4S_00072 [Serratia phage 4S]|nr:hypothetical protein MYO4S_00072 [Serratia phage 4S]
MIKISFSDAEALSNRYKEWAGENLVNRQLGKSAPHDDYHMQIMYSISEYMAHHLKVAVFFNRDIIIVSDEMVTKLSKVL